MKFFQGSFKTLRKRSFQPVKNNRKFSTFWGGSRWETKGYPLHFEFYKTKYDKLLDMSRRRSPRGHFRHKLYHLATYFLFAVGMWEYLAFKFSEKSWDWYGSNAEYFGYLGRLPREYGRDEANVINTFRRGPGPRIATYYPDYPEFAIEEHQRRLWKYANYAEHYVRPSNVPFWYETPEGEEYKPIYDY